MITLILAIINNTMSYARAVWDFLEPIIGLVSFVLIVMTWLRIKVIRRSVKKADGFRNNKIIAIETAHPIEAAVIKHFGSIDVLIRVHDILGKPLVETEEEAQIVVKKVFENLVKHQLYKIHLVVTGAPAVNVLLGQVIGMNSFDITTYQYTTGHEYIALPQPDASWKQAA